MRVHIKLLSRGKYFVNFFVDPRKNNIESDIFTDIITDINLTIYLKTYRYLKKTNLWYLSWF